MESRQLLLRECIELFPPDTNKKVEGVCRTRWIEKVIDMVSFKELFIPIVYCLRKKKIYKDNNCNADTSVTAYLFFRLFSTFQLVSCSVLTKSILDIILPVTQLLHSKSIAMCDRLHLILSFITLVLTIRQEVDEFLSRWSEKALTLTEKINIPDAIPKVVGTQIHRSNTPAGSVSDYFKRAITILLIRSSYVQIRLQI